MHYRTIGSPRRDGSGRVSNAVLMLHGTGGSGAGFLRDQFAGELFQPGQLLDAKRTGVAMLPFIGKARS